MGEMTAINNGKLIENTLASLLQYLKQAEPGSLCENSVLRFEFDASLNEARNLLVQMIRNKSPAISVLAFKVLLMLGLIRSCVEDFLVLISLIEE